MKIEDLKVTKERVLKAASTSVEAEVMLKELFPEAFDGKEIGWYYCVKGGTQYLAYITGWSMESYDSNYFVNMDSGSHYALRGVFKTVQNPATPEEVSKFFHLLCNENNLNSRNIYQNK